VDALTLLVALLLVALLVLSLTVGRGRVGRYFMKPDPALDQRAHEVWMGGAADGYVPPPEFGPSPRERLRSPEVDDSD
jgi:hypothetical protein